MKCQQLSELATNYCGYSYEERGLFLEVFTHGFHEGMVIGGFKKKKAIVATLPWLIALRSVN